MLSDTVELRLCQCRRAVLQMRPFFFDLAGELLRPKCFDEYLDTRFEGIVAATETVVDAQDRLDVAEQVLPLSSIRRSRPMSLTWITVRSVAAAFTAILNLRGRKANSGLKVDHWRISSHQGRVSAISSAATPAK